MGTPYTIKSGGTLGAIAKRNGLAGWQQLYNSPENAAFRAKRPNPSQIFPGDMITIPSNLPNLPSTPGSPSSISPRIMLLPVCLRPRSNQ